MKPRSIKNLKKYVADGSCLVSGTGAKTVIRRYGNNIIKIRNKSVSWKHLQDLVCNGSWDLLDPAGTPVFKTTARGGVRPNAGAPRKADKKKPVSFGLTGETRTELETLCNRLGCNKSELIARLIHEKYDREIHSDSAVSNLKEFCDDVFGPGRHIRESHLCLF